MEGKYQRGKIYTIRCRNDNSKIYVGSTIETLCSRMSKHRYDSKLEKCNSNLYKMVKEDSWDNWYIELYENYPCNSKEELCKREGEIIREIGTLNMLLPCRTLKEYRAEFPEIIRQQNNSYDKTNKKLLQKQTVSCDLCGSIVTKYKLNRHKNSAICLKNNITVY